MLNAQNFEPKELLLRIKNYDLDIKVDHKIQEGVHIGCLLDVNAKN